VFLTACSAAACAAGSAFAAELLDDGVREDAPIAITNGA
jgi:hypothetical protein